MLYRLIVLEHGKLLAGNALDGRAHVFVFDEVAIFVLEEVLHINANRRSIVNVISVLGNER